MNFYASVVLPWLTQIAKFSFSIFVPMQQYRSPLLKKTYTRIVVSMNKTRVNMLLQRASKIKKESIPSHFSAAFLRFVISILNNLQRYTTFLVKKTKKNSPPFIIRLQQQQRRQQKLLFSSLFLPDYQSKQFIIFDISANFVNLHRLEHELI